MIKPMMTFIRMMFISKIEENKVAVKFLTQQTVAAEKAGRV